MKRSNQDFHKSNAVVLAGLFVGLTVLPVSAQGYDDVKINALIEQMSVQEKVNLLRADPKTRENGMWETHGLDRLGIQKFIMSDGPHGVRFGDKATAFPNGPAMGATWDMALLERMGQVMGKQNRAFGNNVQLGPCVDITRDPRVGRAAESPGEEPFLNGKVGAAITRGIQSVKTIAIVKHFAANTYEKNRNKNNYTMDARTLREFYGLPFRITVQEANVWSVMAAYNFVNDSSCTASEELLGTILRDEWGFKYFVNSDWGSLYVNGGLGLKAGLDVEMPAAKRKGSRFTRDLPGAVNNKEVEMTTLDQAVRRVLRAKMEAGLVDNKAPAPNPADIDSPESRAVALEIAQKSLVLLKNDGNLLPFDAAKIGSIALIGPNADVAQLGAFGSSEIVKPAYAITPHQGLKNRAPGVTINYEKGCDMNSADTKGFEAAIAAAKKSDVVVFVGGLDATQEGEGYGSGSDRKSGSVQLPGQQQALINELAKVNPKVVVVLVSGGITAVESSIGNVRGLIQAFYPGQEGGNAIADVLLGNVNPSGHLPVSMPKNDTQLPEWMKFDFSRDVVDGFGYRKFDKQGLTPQYAFGYGLSYTTFEYSNLRIVPKTSKGDAKLQVSADVKNTGKRDGDDVVQLYTSVAFTDPNAVSAIPMPVKQLRGFSRVSIPAGKTKTVTFTLEPNELAFWSVSDKSFRVEAGTYTVRVGNSSDQLPLTGTFNLTSSVLYNSIDRTTRPAPPLAK